MEAMSPEEFLKRLSDHREAFWEKMTAERKSYGAEKPLSPEIILRRLQFGVVMERKAAEVSAPWVSRLPELELQHCLSEYVANELKHPTDYEMHKRPTPVEEKKRQRDHNQGDADAVRQLVHRMLMLGFVVFDEGFGHLF